MNNSEYFVEQGDCAFRELQNIDGAELLLVTIVVLWPGCNFKSSQFSHENNMANMETVLSYDPYAFCKAVNLVPHFLYEKLQSIRNHSLEAA